MANERRERDEICLNRSEAGPVAPITPVEVDFKAEWLDVYHYVVPEGYRDAEGVVWALYVDTVGSWWGRLSEMEAASEDAAVYSEDHVSAWQAWLCGWAPIAGVEKKE